MAQDKLDRLGPMIGTIGEEAAEIVGGDPDGLFLYVEVGDRWSSVSVFKEDDDVVRYYELTSELDDLIMEAWEAEDAGKRWSVMEYEVHGTKFDATFKYPEEVNVEFFEVDRREIALKKRYGDKPVIYPPIPEHFEELTRD